MWPTFYAFAAYYAQEALSSWVVRRYVCASVSPFIYIHLYYFVISVANNYKTIQYNTTRQKASTDFCQIEQASNVTKSTRTTEKA